MIHLVAERLSVVLVQVHPCQLAIMGGVKLLEAVQSHHRLLPDQILGVARQGRHSWQHRVDEVWPNEPAYCGQRRAHCTSKYYGDPDRQNEVAVTCVKGASRCVYKQQMSRGTDQ